MDSRGNKFDELYLSLESESKATSFFKDIENISHVTSKDQAETPPLKITPILSGVDNLQKKKKPTRFYNYRNNVTDAIWYNNYVKALADFHYFMAKVREFNKQDTEVFNFLVHKPKPFDSDQETLAIVISKGWDGFAQEMFFSVPENKREELLEKLKKNEANKDIISKIDRLKLRISLASVVVDLSHSSSSSQSVHVASTLPTLAPLEADKDHKKEVELPFIYETSTNSSSTQQQYVFPPSAFSISKSNHKPLLESRASRDEALILDEGAGVMNKVSQAIKQTDKTSLASLENKNLSTIINRRLLVHPNNKAQLEAQLKAASLCKQVCVNPFMDIDIFKTVAKNLFERCFLVVAPDTPAKKILAVLPELKATRGLLLPNTFSNQELLKIVEEFPAGRVLAFAKEIPIKTIVHLLPYLKPGVKLLFIPRDKNEILLMTNAIGAGIDIMVAPELFQWESEIVHAYRNRPAVKKLNNQSMPSSSISNSHSSINSTNQLVINTMPITDFIALYGASKPASNKKRNNNQIQKASEDKAPEVNKRSKKTGKKSNKKQGGANSNENPPVSNSHSAISKLLSPLTEDKRPSEEPASFINFFEQLSEPSIEAASSNPVEQAYQLSLQSFLKSPINKPNNDADMSLLNNEEESRYNFLI